MRYSAFVAILLACAPQNAAMAGVENRYAKWKLGQPFGYRDLKLTRNRWKIRSMTFHAGMDFPTAMALHRVAVHAKANGFARFTIVSMKVTCSNLFLGAPAGCVGTSLDEEVDIIAQGYRDGDTIPACEEKGRWAANCTQLEVEKVLTDLRVPLRLTIGQVEQEIAATRLLRASK